MRERGNKEKRKKRRQGTKWSQFCIFRDRVRKMMAISLFGGAQNDVGEWKASHAGCRCQMSVEL